MLLKELKEGWFVGRKKEDAKPKSQPLTTEERDLIKRMFPANNVDTKTGTGEYLFDSNAHAVYKNLHLSFYKKGDELRVSVAYYDNHSGPSDPKKSPQFHTDHAVSEDELERIKATAR